jgi:hypothetical protein
MPAVRTIGSATTSPRHQVRLGLGYINMAASSLRLSGRRIVRLNAKGELVRTPHPDWAVASVWA